MNDDVSFPKHPLDQILGRPSYSLLPIDSKNANFFSPAVPTTTRPAAPIRIPD